jgi:hypothetical protein
MSGVPDEFRETGAVLTVGRDVNNPTIPTSYHGGLAHFIAHPPGRRIADSIRMLGQPLGKR